MKINSQFLYSYIFLMRRRNQISICTFKCHWKSKWGFTKKKYL